MWRMVEESAANSLAATSQRLVEDYVLHTVEARGALLKVVQNVIKEGACARHMEEVGGVWWKIVPRETLDAVSVLLMAVVNAVISREGVPKWQELGDDV